MIVVKNLKKKYNEHIIFNNFTLEICENEITTILGPSGCGKTTFLNILSGIDQEYIGEIHGITDHKFSYIFQEPRLLPWKTVEENIRFVIQDLYAEKKQKEIVEKLLKIVGLLEVKTYYPKELSGGMKQRVAIARAFAYPSDIILMDEPFKGLDLKLKHDLIKSFKRIWEMDKKSVIFITHNIDEALRISNRIVQWSCSPIQVINDFSMKKSNHDIKKELLNKMI